MQVRCLGPVGGNQKRDAAGNYNYFLCRRCELLEEVAELSERRQDNNLQHIVRDDVEVLL